MSTIQPQMFGEIVAPSKKDLFIEKMEELIISGRLRTGDTLPTERELAAEMKVSKTIVHEGIRELKRLGFVDVTSRKGVTVADYAQTGTLDTLISIMHYHAGQLDKKTALSLLDLRCYVENPALLKLAKEHTDDDLIALQKHIDDAKAVTDNPDALSMELFYFHRTLCFLSGNTITPLLINGVIAPCLIFWRDWISLEGVDKSIKQLETFYTLIESGDGKKAVALLDEGTEYFKKATGLM